MFILSSIENITFIIALHIQHKGQCNSFDVDLKVYIGSLEINFILKNFVNFMDAIINCS